MHTRCLTALMTFMLAGAFGTSQAWAERDHNRHDDDSSQHSASHDDDSESRDHDDDDSSESLTEDDIVSFLKDNAPEIHKELQRIGKQNPEEYKERIEDLYGAVWDYRELKEHNPKWAEVVLKLHRSEFKSWKLAEKIEQETDTEKLTERKADLKSLLDQLFDLHLAQQEFELGQLEEEIEEVRGIIEKRRKHRAAILERHFNELTERSAEEDLGWW